MSFDWSRNVFGGSTSRRRMDSWEDFFKQTYEMRGKPEDTEPVIVEHLQNRDVVVYGARAINAQVPERYERPTEDWDVKTFKPKNFVKKLEKKLEELDVRDMFDIESLPVRGEDFKVHRIVSKRTGKPVVDATVPEKSSLPEHVIIDEIKYRVLEAEYQSKLEDVKDPEKRHRRQKDLADLRRIEKAMQDSPSTGQEPVTRARERKPWRLLKEIRR